MKGMGEVRLAGTPSPTAPELFLAHYMPPGRILMRVTGFRIPASLAALLQPKPVKIARNAFSATGLKSRYP